MSRTFSKILVICAMVIVLPLLVVGTVFAAYHSIDSTVKVGVVFVNDEKVSGDITDVYATVKYGDENSEKLEIVKGHTQTATVSAVYSQKAYDFEGWFMGDADAYKQAVASGNADLDKSNEFTFNMANATDVVAVYSVHKFTISYSEEVTAGAATEVKYGDKLADPQAKTDNSIPEEQCYRGWVLNGDNTKRYKYATFDEAQSYSLANPLDTRESVSLTLKQGGTSKTYTAYVEDQDGNAQQVKLNDLDLDEVFESEVKKPGYKYSWKDSEGNVVNEISAEDAEYTLSEEAIQYNAHITKGANITDEVADVTFTAENYEAISNLFNLKSKYSFFEITQIKADETPYEDAQTFVEAFIAAHPDESATAEISVDSESRYKTIKISTGLSTDGHLENCGVVFMSGENDNYFPNNVYNSTGSQKAVNLNSVNIEDNKLIFSLFELLDVNGEVADFYSDEQHSEQVYLVGARIFFASDNSSRIDISRDMTVYDFIEAVLAAWKQQPENASQEFPGATEFNLYQVQLLFSTQKN